MRRVVIWVLRLLLGLEVLALAAASGIVAYHQYYDHVQAKAFERIALGIAEAEVVALAGEPLYVTDRTRWVDPEYPGDTQISGCRRELWYSPRYTFLPSKWSYCFDAEDRLVAKSHWASW